MGDKTIWLVWDGEYEQSSVTAAFTTEEAALAFAGDRSVESQVVWDTAPSPWTYWHRGADVYPDGTHDEWEDEQQGEGEVSILPVDDHLNSRAEPWDGHTQGHCGEHISIFGTDRKEVELAFQRHLAAAVGRQDGRCKDKFARHEREADGATVYEAGFMKLRDKDVGHNRDWECLHEWREWSEWRGVSEDSENRQRICDKCIRFEIAVRWNVGARED